MTEDVAVQGFRIGIFDALVQADHGGLLGDHVYNHIGGQALAPVGKPFDEVGVGDGGHPNRPALVVDLGGVVGVLELADHIAEGAHLTVPQEVGGVPVQGGNFIEGNLGNFGGKVPSLHLEQLPIGPSPENGHGNHRTQQGHDQQQGKENPHRQALGLDEPEILLGPAVFHLKAGGNQGAQEIDQTEQAHEHIKIAGLEVDGGECQIEIDKSHDEGYDQIEHNFPALASGQVELLFWGLTHEEISF